MKLVAQNDKILKFIKEEICYSDAFKSKNLKYYNLDTSLSEEAKYDTSIVELIIECEKNFDIYINDKDAWGIDSILDLYNIIKKELKNKNGNKDT